MYYFLQKPWKKLELAAEPRAEQIDKSNPYSPWTRIRKPKTNLVEDVETIPQLFEKVVAQYGDKHGYGYRQILDECDDVQSNGRVFKKFVLDDEFLWFSFNEMQQRVNHVASGFLQQGNWPFYLNLSMLI